MGDNRTRASSGRDQTWFEDLFRDHHRAVLAYARRRVGDSDADDVVAEVFAVAWRKRGEVPTRALPWLYSVAAREVLHLHRGARRRLALDDRVAHELSAPAEDEFALADDRLSAQGPVRRALDRLSDSDAEILRLWAWEQLEPSEIADVLGVSAVAARVRLHRARRRLESHLRAPAWSGFGPSPEPRPAPQPSIHTGSQGGTP